MFRTIFNWLSRVHARRRVARKGGFRPQLEALEDRYTPALYRVLNTLDDGGGSLREAIAFANQDTDLDTIEFNIGTPSKVITLASTLTITNPVIIDGNSQPGFAGAPLIVLESPLLPFGDAIHIQSWGSTVRSLVIQGFSVGAGIHIDGWGFNHVENCYLGTDATGTAAEANDFGVWIDNSGMNVIGGYAEGTGNIISGNTSGGVRVTGSGMQNQVSNNLIGVAFGGGIPLANGGFGVRFQGGLSGIIMGNVISANAGNGIELVSDSDNNFILGNFIGTTWTNLVGIGNGGHGIYVASGSSNNYIGTTDAAGGNIISGNGNAGIWITGAFSGQNFVRNNVIGLGSDGVTVIGNGTALPVGGVVIYNAPSNVIGGDRDAQQGNLISGNNGNGVSITGTDPMLASNNAVYGNFIGTDYSGTLDRGNTGAGVYVSTAQSTKVGGTAAEGNRNVISGNDQPGIEVYSSAMTVIVNNLVGTTWDGTNALGNGAQGILINGSSSDTQIGGMQPFARNIVSSNSSHGIALTDSSVRTTIQTNYIGTDITGNLPRGNTGSGVYISAGSSNNTIGGGAMALGNKICANTDYGVEVLGSNNFIDFNVVGIGLPNGHAKRILGANNTWGPNNQSQPD